MDLAWPDLLESYSELIVQLADEILPCFFSFRVR